MALVKSLPNDEGYWNSEERNLKRQKTEHVTSVPQDGVSDLEIAESCLLLAKLTLDEPPAPPPILIVTDDTHTPSLIEKRLARAARIGRDETLAEINRIAISDTTAADEGFVPERVWLDFIHPLWQSRKAKKYGFKEPDWKHPFLNHNIYLRGEFFKQM